MTSGQILSRRLFCGGAVAGALMTGCARTPVQAQDPAGSAWHARASLPYKVQEIYPAVCNGRIHVAGGFIAQFSTIVGATDRHTAYDPASDSWAELAALPEARHHPHLVAHAGQLWALGGFRVDGPGSVWVMQPQSWVHEPGAEQWRAAANAPEPHGETVSASIGDRIHVVGGRRPRGTANRTWGDHTDSDRHLVFDPVADSWATAAPALSKRNSAAGALIDGSFYIAGGRTVSGGNVRTLEIYDPAEDRWRTGAPMPQGQGGLAAAALDGKLYAFGGEYFDNGGGVYPECWVYDPAADTWQASAPMLSPRHGLGGVSLDGWIYAVAGASQAGGNDTSDALERFRPA